MLDVGANIGISTRVLAIRFPAAMAGVVERHAENFELLVRNTEGIGGMAAGLHATLWESDAPLWVRTGEDGENWSLYVFAHDRTGAEVPGITEPSLLSRFEIKRVDVMKIDVEGGDLEVFADVTDWIGRVEIALEAFSARWTGGRFWGRLVRGRPSSPP